MNGSCGFYGLKIFIILETWVRQNGQRETEAEHLLHNTWPQEMIVILTSLVRQTRHNHAAFAPSASLTAASAFSCNNHVFCR